MSDVVPTQYLRPLWERARKVFSGEHHRRRPASPSEVLALISFVDCARKYVLMSGDNRTAIATGIPWLKHKKGCPCAGYTAISAVGPGLCTCGLDSLYHSERILERAIREYSGRSDA